MKSKIGFALLLVFLSGNLQAKKEKSEGDSPKFRRYEDLDRKFNKQVAAKRLQEANYIKKLIRSSRFGKKNKAPFILRLAELYWDQARYEFDLEVSRYGKQYASWKKRGKRGREPQPGHRKSRNLYKQSIQIAKQVLKPSSKAEYKQKALYFIGFNQIELDNGLDGIKHLKRILKKYKRGDYYAQAVVKIADYYFDKARAMQAISFYSKLLNARDPGLKSYLMYKISWCYMKLGRGQKALKSFKKVRTYILRHKSKKRMGLLEEVEKDMLKAFALFNSAKSAKRFIRKTYGQTSYKKTREKYEYLATLYKIKKLRQSAAHMYYEIISLNPMDVKNIEIEIMLFDLFQKPFNKEGSSKQIARIAKRYGPKSEWFARHGKKSKVMVKLEEMMRLTSTQTHEKAVKFIKSRKQKVSKLTAYAETIRMYSRYLKVFNKHVNAYNIRYIYAQLLFDLKKFRMASVEFTKLYKQKPNGKHAKTAVLNSVACVDLLRPKKLKKRKDLKKYKISKIETEFLAASKRYIDKYPRDLKTSDDLKYKSAMIYYQYNLFDKAIPIFKYFIYKSNNKVLKRASVNNMMIIYDRKRDIKGLSAFAAAVASKPSLRKISLSLKLASVHQNAELKLAANLEKKGKKVAAADAYYAFYNKFKRSKDRKKVLYNALVLYQKEGKTQKANQLHLIVVTKYPRDPIAVNSYKYLAKNHNDFGEYHEAAQYYMRLYKSGLVKTKAGMLALIFNVAQLYNMINKDSLAIRYYLQIEKGYPGTKEAIESLLARAKIAEVSRQYRAAIKLYGQYFTKARVSQNDLAYYYAKFAEWNREYLKSNAGSKAWYKKILTLNPKSLKSGMEYYAEARFDKASIPFNAFGRMTAIAKIQQAMPTLINEYKLISSLGSHKWWIASLTRVGAIYEHFGHAIADAPLPSEKELGGASIEDYKKEINTVVAQNLKEAQLSYAKAIAEGEKSSVYSSYLFKARRRLAIVKGEIPKSMPWWKDRLYLVITDNSKDKIYYERQ